MTQATIETDIVIIGGGVAGLWLLNQLTARGWETILLEKQALGAGQTIASQGMIHGGVKYALGGALSSASEAIAEMPGRWRAALAGSGEVNLSATKVLSDHFYMWSDGGLGSRLGTFFASKALRGRMQPVKRADYPPVFASPGFSGKLLRLADLVLDVPSLLANLQANCKDRVFLCDAGAQLRKENGQTVLQTAAGTIRAQRFLLTAGTGNEELVTRLGTREPATQRRPLHQVLVKHEFPHPLYGHAVGTNPTPRLTISTHHTTDGSPVWYLGGDLAEENIKSSPEQVIEKARLELQALFPWIDLGAAEWKTLYIDRAEPKQPRLLRPDKACALSVAGYEDVIACWPTKLALAPNLATEIEQLLAADGLKPRGSDELDGLAVLGRPAIARAAWETMF